ncbi:MAG: OmpA family protein [Betaproteobacteria bacterium]|nr:OmpA family protein [Betaproteobacteria bacterium]
MISLPEDVLFDLGSAELSARGRDALAVAVQRLVVVLPCYVANQRAGRTCPGNRYGHEIETIFIEGHTDNRPLLRPGYDNTNLSLDRARAVQRALVQGSALQSYQNKSGQPLFSFSAYADTRPLKDLDPLRCEESTSRPSHRLDSAHRGADSGIGWWQVGEKQVDVRAAANRLSEAAGRGAGHGHSCGREPTTDSGHRPAAASGLRARACRDVSGLSIGELRKLPFAYWVPPAQPLPLTDPDLVQRYWAEALPQAVESGPRRAKRWLTPLFFTYCESFDLNDQWFSDFAKRVALAVGRSEGAFAAKLADLQRDLAFFQPNWVGPRLAGALLSNPRRLDDAFADHLLWPGFVDTPLGGHVFESALGLGGERLREWPVIARLLDWAKRLASPVQKSRHRVAFADALLKPWYRKRPPDTVKSTLITFFVGAYGDPRMEGHRQYQWKGVAPEAISVLMGWLAGDTLRGFMRVLERTADEIWSFRRKFWMAFYDAGHIEEAWLALGSDARLVARKLLVDERGMGFGRLEGGAAPNQSVLLLKIGHLVFTEWSHNEAFEPMRMASVAHQSSMRPSTTEPTFERPFQWTFMAAST